MQGKPRTRATVDLSFIFFKIRETRDTATRRSWTRRARLALVQRDDLTPAERHEVMCVWSRSNSHRIDSPAMSKVFNIEHRPQPHQTISARSLCRRRFDVKKPAFSGLSANDDTFISETCTVSRTDQILPAVPRHQESFRCLHACLW